MGDRQILTVTAQDAARAKAPPEVLAAAWARQLLTAAGEDPTGLRVETGDEPEMRLESSREALNPDAPAERTVPVHDARTGAMLGQGRIAGAASDVGLVRAIAVRSRTVGARAGLEDALPVREIGRGRAQRRVFGVKVLQVNLDETARSTSLSDASRQTARLAATGQ